MLEHCSEHNFGRLVRREDSKKIDGTNNLNSGVDFEIDGLLVFNNVFVYIEVKTTVQGSDLRGVVIKALENTKTLSTTDLGLDCRSKPAVVVLAYKLMKEPDQKKDPGLTISETRSYMEEHNVIQLTTNGSEFGFIHDGKVKSCSPKQSCDDFCKLVADRVQDVSQFAPQMP